MPRSKDRRRILPRLVIMSVTAATLGALLAPAAAVAAPSPPPSPGPAAPTTVHRTPQPKTMNEQPGHGRSSTLIDVKFAEGSDVRVRNGRLVSRRSGAIGALDAVLRRFPGVSANRLFTTSETQLAGIKRDREAGSGRTQADLNLYFRLRVAAGGDVSALADALNALPIVESADLALAPVAPPTPSYVARQGYRTSAASDGIDADYAQTLAGGKGEYVRIIDAEYGWNRSHEDLDKLRVAGSDIRVGTPVNNYGTDHGTAVIGEIAGSPNVYGVTGLAPSAWIGTTNTNSVEYGYNIAQAVITASQYLRAGDVLLIEQQIAGPNGCGTTQVGCVAVEWDNATYDAIVSATSKGIVVIEPAGNGTQNLDSSIYGANFPRGRADSGAIIVGAGNPLGCSSYGAIATRGRLPFSNYGSRVDVQGWGSCVTSTGYGDLQNISNATYTATFGGTSSASPIVASAAGLLESVAKARGTTLTPAQVRSVLTATGSAQPTGDAGHIGPLPNLRSAIAALGTASKPTVTAPQHYVPNGAVLGSTVAVREYWSASDPTGITACVLYVQVDGGTWTQLSLPAAASTSVNVQLTPGHTYSFAVAVRNGAGTWSNYAYDTAFIPRALQENTNVSYTAGWTRAAWADASGGYLDVSGIPGAKASFTFTARNVAWVATKATNRGQADVYLDGVYKERVDLYSATTVARSVVRSYYWPSSGLHTISLVVVGTANRPKIDVDAFVIS